MCIWSVKPEDRHCEYCSYRKGCERFPKRIMDPKANRYVRIMSDIIGANILFKSRKQRIAWARHMVAYQLRREGYSLEKAGGAIGLNHATVLNCERQVSRMIENPQMYPNETEIWQKFLSLQKQ